MAIILIDTRHIGSALKAARKECHLTLIAVAGGLHIPVHDLGRYERGKTVIPNDILIRLFRFGLHYQPRNL